MDRDIVEKLKFGCPFKPGTIGEKDAERAESVMLEGAAEIEKLRKRPLLRLGSFTISTMGADSVWLQKEGEEGMQISMAEFEEELQRMFEERF